MSVEHNHVLRLEPEELVFTNVRLKKAYTRRIKISNSLPHQVAITIKPGSPRRYRVVPSSVAIPGNGSVFVEVTLKLEKRPAKNKFLGEQGQKDTFRITSDFFEQQFFALFYAWGVNPDRDISRSATADGKSAAPDAKTPANKKSGRAKRAQADSGLLSYLPEDAPTPPGVKEGAAATAAGPGQTGINGTTIENFSAIPSAAGTSTPRSAAGVDARATATAAASETVPGPTPPYDASRHALHAQNLELQHQLRNAQTDLAIAREEAAHLRMDVDQANRRVHTLTEMQRHTSQPDVQSRVQALAKVMAEETVFSERRAFEEKSRKVLAILRAKDAEISELRGSLASAKDRAAQSDTYKRMCDEAKAEAARAGDASTRLEATLRLLKKTSAEGEAARARIAALEKQNAQLQSIADASGSGRHQQRIQEQQTQIEALIGKLDAARKREAEVKESGSAARRRADLGAMTATARERMDRLLIENRELRSQLNAEKVVYSDELSRLRARLQRPTTKRAKKGRATPRVALADKERKLKIMEIKNSELAAALRITHQELTRSLARNKRENQSRGAVGDGGAAPEPEPAPTPTQSMSRRGGKGAATKSGDSKAASGPTETMEQMQARHADETRRLEAALRGMSRLQMAKSPRGLERKAQQQSETIGELRQRAEDLQRHARRQQQRIDELQVENARIRQKSVGLHEAKLEAEATWQAELTTREDEIRDLERSLMRQRGQTKVNVACLEETIKTLSARSDMHKAAAQLRSQLTELRLQVAQFQGEAQRSEEEAAEARAQLEQARSNLRAARSSAQKWEILGNVDDVAGSDLKRDETLARLGERLEAQAKEIVRLNSMLRAKEAEFDGRTRALLKEVRTQRASEDDAVGARTLADMQRSRLMDMESKALSREDVIKSLSQQRDHFCLTAYRQQQRQQLLSQELAEYKQRCLSLNARVLEAASAANEENARFDAKHAKELKAYQKQVSDQAVELDKARRNEAKAAESAEALRSRMERQKQDFESRVTALKQQSKADRDKLAQERQTATKLRKAAARLKALLKEKIGQIGVLMETVEALQPAPTPAADAKGATEDGTGAADPERIGTSPPRSLVARKLIHFAAHLSAAKAVESTLESQVERMHRAAQDKADRAAELGDTVERLRRTVARLEAEREAQAELLEELREDAFALRQQASTREADLSDQRRLVAELQSELEAAGRASDALQERLRDTRKQSLERLASQRKEHQAALEEAAGTRRSEVWLSTSPMQLDSDGPPTVPFVGPAVAAELRALRQAVQDAVAAPRGDGGATRSRSNESSRRRARSVGRSRASAQRRAAPQPSQDSPGSAAPLLKIIPMVVEEMSKILLQNDEAVYASERRARSLESACRVQNERLAVADARVVNIVSQLKVAQAERGRLERALADTRTFFRRQVEHERSAFNARARALNGEIERARGRQIDARLRSLAAEKLRAASESAHKSLRRKIGLLEVERKSIAVQERAAADREVRAKLAARDDAIKSFVQEQVQGVLLGGGDGKDTAAGLGRELATLRLANEELSSRVASLREQLDTARQGERAQAALVAEADARIRELEEEQVDKKLAAADGAAEAGPGSASAPEAERPLADGARSTKTRSDDMVADARDEAARLRVEVAYQSKEIQRLSREASAGASEKQQLTERLTAAMQQFEGHVAANETKISSLRKQWRRQLELFQKKGLLRATLSAAAGPSNQGIDSGFAQKLKDEVMDLTRRLSEAEIRIRNQADDISAKKHALKELEVALIKNGSRRRRRGLVREPVNPDTPETLARQLAQARLAEGAALRKVRVAARAEVDLRGKISARDQRITLLKDQVKELKNKLRVCGVDIKSVPDAGSAMGSSGADPRENALGHEQQVAVYLSQINELRRKLAAAVADRPPTFAELASRSHPDPDGSELKRVRAQLEAKAAQEKLLRGQVKKLIRSEAELKRCVAELSGLRGVKATKVLSASARSGSSVRSMGRSGRSKSVRAVASGGADAGGGSLASAVLRLSRDLKSKEKEVQRLKRERKEAASAPRKRGLRPSDLASDISGRSAATDESRAVEAAQKQLIGDLKDQLRRTQRALETARARANSQRSWRQVGGGSGAPSAAAISVTNDAAQVVRSIRSVTRQLQERIGAAVVAVTAASQPKPRAKARRSEAFQSDMQAASRRISELSERLQRLFEREMAEKLLNPSGEQLRALQANCDSLESRLRQKQIEAEDYVRTVQNLQAELAEAREAAAAAPGAGLAPLSATAKGASGRERRRAQDAERRVEELEQKLRTQQRAAKDARARIQGLQGALDAVRTSSAAASAAAATPAERGSVVAAAAASRAAERERLVVALQEQVASLQQKNLQMTLERASAAQPGPASPARSPKRAVAPVSSPAQLDAELQRQRLKVSELEAALASLRELANDYDAKLRAARADQNSATSQITAQRERSENLQGRLEQQDELLGQMKGKFEASQKLVGEVRAQLEKSEERVRALEAAAKEASVTTADLRAQLQRVSELKAQEQKLMMQTSNAALDTARKAEASFTEQAKQQAEMFGRLTEDLKSKHAAEVKELLSRAEEAERSLRSQAAEREEALRKTHAQAMLSTKADYDAASAAAARAAREATDKELKSAQALARGERDRASERLQRSADAFARLKAEFDEFRQTQQDVALGYQTQITRLRERFEKLLGTTPADIADEAMARLSGAGGIARKAKALLPKKSQRGGASGSDKKGPATAKLERRREFVGRMSNLVSELSRLDALVARFKASSRKLKRKNTQLKTQLARQARVLRRASGALVGDVDISGLAVAAAEAAAAEASSEDQLVAAQDASVLTARVSSLEARVAAAARELDMERERMVHMTAVAKTRDETLRVLRERLREAQGQLGSLRDARNADRADHKRELARVEASVKARRDQQALRQTLAEYKVASRQARDDIKRKSTLIKALDKELAAAKSRAKKAEADAKTRGERLSKANRLLQIRDRLVATLRARVDNAVQMDQDALQAKDAAQNKVITLSAALDRTRQTVNELRSRNKSLRTELRGAGDQVADSAAHVATIATLRGDLKRSKAIVKSLRGKLATIEADFLRVDTKCRGLELALGRAAKKQQADGARRQDAKAVAAANGMARIVGSAARGICTTMRLVSDGLAELRGAAQAAQPPADADDPDASLMSEIGLQLNFSQAELDDIMGSDGAAGRRVGDSKSSAGPGANRRDNVYLDIANSVLRVIEGPKATAAQPNPTSKTRPSRVALAPQALATIQNAFTRLLDEQAKQVSLLITMARDRIGTGAGAAPVGEDPADMAERLARYEKIVENVKTHVVQQRSQFEAERAKYETRISRLQEAMQSVNQSGSITSAMTGE